MSKENMMDGFIKKFGFEDELTIQFCEMCEDEKVSYERVAFIYAVIITAQKIKKNKKST